MTEQKYDVAILGSGITGSILAAILARNGVKTLLIEQGVHPRFAIGESTVPETTFHFRLLAARYGVPELNNLSTYTKLRRRVATTCGVKRNFSFVFHRANEKHRPEECCQMATLSPPLGPDMHMFRQDVDSYLLNVAASYGATVRQQTDVTEVTIDGGVRMKTRTGEEFQCEYVVDAGGPKAPLAELFGLRETPCPLKTSSRGLYTHMAGVKPFDACTAAQSVHQLPSAMSQGTLHHIFEGGWMWVIPFDNHPASTNQLCSVGLLLDPKIHPPTTVSPEEEFRGFIARYPALADQFAHASAIRPWIRASRLQFSSTKCVGDRFCLVPHAFAFVDPLFSSGLTVSMSAINMLAWRLIRAKADGNYALDRFLPIDARVKSNIAYFDSLVSRSYVAFANFNLWNAWYRVWALGTVYGALGVLEALGHYLETGDPVVFDACEEAPFSGAQASELPEYRALFERAGAEIDRVQQGKLDPEEASLRIFAALKESGLWPKPWKALTRGVRSPGLATVPELGPFLKWVRKDAPECLRKNYFVHFGMKRMISMVFQDFAAEARHGLSSFGLLARDFARGYNMDWAERRALPPPRQ